MERTDAIRSEGEHDIHVHDICSSSSALFCLVRHAVLKSRQHQIPKETFFLLQERSCGHTGWTLEVANGWHTFESLIASTDQSRRMVVAMLLVLRRLLRGGASRLSCHLAYSLGVSQMQIIEVFLKQRRRWAWQEGLTLIPPPDVYCCRFH